MKRLFFILMLVLGFSFSMLAQVDEEEGQYFGGVRAMGSHAYAQYDFGNITSDIVTHEFTIKNPSPSKLVITSLDIPNGVTVTVVNKEIMPRSEGKIIVTIDKKYFTEKGSFALPMIVRTEQMMGQGVKVEKEILYLIKGMIK